MGGELQLFPFFSLHFKSSFLPLFPLPAHFLPPIVPSCLHKLIPFPNCVLFWQTIYLTPFISGFVSYFPLGPFHLSFHFVFPVLTFPSSDSCFLCASWYLILTWTCLVGTFLSHMTILANKLTLSLFISPIYSFRKLKLDNEITSKREVVER